MAKPHCYYDNEVVGWSTSWQGGVLANPSILPIHEYTEVELFERGALFLPIVSPVTFMCGWWQSHWPHNYIVQFSGPAESNEKWNCLRGGGPFPKILNLNSVTSYIYDDDNLVSLTIIQFLGPDWSNWRAIQQFSNLKTDKRQVKRVFMRVGMNICPEAKRSPHLLA